MGLTKGKNNMQFDKLFSERQKELRGEVPDVYQYDIIPRELRVQVIFIMKDIFDSRYEKTAETETYKFIHDSLCRAYGEYPLGQDSNFNIHIKDNDYLDIVVKFLRDTDNVERVIDVIELFFQKVKPRTLDIPKPESSTPNAQRNYSKLLLYITQKKRQYEEAITTLNSRFRKHGVGYQYESDRIIQIDSKFIHSEAMKPALGILSDPMYEGANDEFLKAHKHYRTGDYKACMNECLKAFESTIKTICEVRGWDHENKNGVRLIQIVFDKGLIPSFMQTHFTALRKTLEDGALNPRNQRSGHGQGSKIIPVPECMAAYALHLTASNILFLTKANEKMK